MAKRQRDWIDNLGEQWARQRRRVIGYVSPKTSAEFIGSLASLSGRLQRDAEGACQGGVSQSYPEVYVGTPHHVNQVWQRMPLLRRDVWELAYVYEGPIKLRAAVVGISREQFYEIWEQARAFMDGALAQELRPEPDSVSTTKLRELRDLRLRTVSKLAI